MPRPYIIHGGKPEREAILDDLWTGLRDRLDAILPNPQVTENKETDKPPDLEHQ